MPLRWTKGALAAALLSLAGSMAWAARAQDLPQVCAGLCRGAPPGHFVAAADGLGPAAGPVDERLAVVDRTPLGALGPGYVPDDLVDVETMRPARASRCRPPGRQCLRREAARAYRGLARAMREAGERPYVSSAYRAYTVQCATFLGWARSDGFCEATASSALPGHSEHQLGTTLDLFTYAWTQGGDKFRPGYGCSAGGRWLAEHAHEHGFVLPYPLHPDYRREGSSCEAREGAEGRVDPRTGYRYEPWHLRFVGVEAARRFRAAWLASGPGTVGELTLGQWLRSERGLAPTGAPVCDGCNCDRCATLATGGPSPCAQPPLSLDADGLARSPAHAPRVDAVRLAREGERLWVEAEVEVAPNTWTQPPVVTEASGAAYRRGSRAVWLASGASREFGALAGTYRLVIGFDDREDWPWSAALVAPDRDGVANGLSAPIVAAPGRLRLRVPLDGVSPGTVVRVGLARGARARRVRSERAP